jgi:hypothetical protein
MARGGPPASLCDMDRTTRRVSLELRTEEGPPAGVAYGDDGTRREFCGWLGLICALDALLAPGGPPLNPHEPED